MSNWKLNKTITKLSVAGLALVLGFSVSSTPAFAKRRGHHYRPRVIRLNSAKKTAKRAKRANNNYSRQYYVRQVQSISIGLGANHKSMQRLYRRLDKSNTKSVQKLYRNLKTVYYHINHCTYIPV